jgi:hypothetical protein
MGGRNRKEGKEMDKIGELMDDFVEEWTEGVRLRRKTQCG